MKLLRSEVFTFGESKGVAYGDNLKYIAEGNAITAAKQQLHWRSQLHLPGSLHRQDSSTALRAQDDTPLGFIEIVGQGLAPACGFVQQNHSTADGYPVWQDQGPAIHGENETKTKIS